MNFALGAIIIIIILTPGAVFHRAYFSSFEEKQASIHIPISDLLLRGMILSIIVHLICLKGLYLFGVTFDFKLIYQIISGASIEFNNKIGRAHV